MAKGVFTFVCRLSGKGWTAKQHSGDLEDSAPTAYELQRKLIKLAAAADSSGGTVQSSFSLVTPKSAVFQVIIGRATFAGAPAAPAAGAAAGTAAGTAQAAPAEEKEEEEAEEEEDDLGFSLFD